MVRSLEFIRPPDIPYMLLSFQFYFENEDSHWINIYHAAGMHLIYGITRICYLFPQNWFYELLQLQNTEVLHEQKYNWLLMKGVFDGAPNIKVKILIENQKDFDQLHPGKRPERLCPGFHRLPAPGNDIVIAEAGGEPVFYHFFCNDVQIEPGQECVLHLFYLNSYRSIDAILDLWFDEHHEPCNGDTGSV